MRLMVCDANGGVDETDGMRLTGRDARYSRTYLTALAFSRLP